MALLSGLHNKQQLGLLNAPAHEFKLEGIQTERQAVQRRTVDAAGSYVHLLSRRLSQRSATCPHGMQPTAAASTQPLPASACVHQPAVNFNIRFAHASLSKAKSTLVSIVWTPDGRRCMTGSQRGEFTMWGGTSFTYDTALQGHEAAVRCIRFTHNGNFILSVDDGGRLKYWRTNYELLKDERAHQEGACAVSLAPSDLKFATCSNDSTVKVWDFATCTAERVLTGHGGDVKSADWHPRQALIASGSKDSLIKIWDAKSDSTLATLHGHNNMVSVVQWNANGNWLLSAGRDQTCKVWDLRMLKELGSYKSHVKDVLAAAWHPVHEELFSSGSQDGALKHWLVSRSAPQAEVEAAQEGSINAMAWHPVGHMLATSGSDWTARFWTQARADEGRTDGSERKEAAVPEGDAPQARKAPVLPAGGAIPGIGPIGAGMLPGPPRPPSPGPNAGMLLPRPLGAVSPMSGSPRPRPPPGPPPGPPPSSISGAKRALDMQPSAPSAKVMRRGVNAAAGAQQLPGLMLASEPARLQQTGQRPLPRPPPGHLPQQRPHR